jgi:VanZ family protein
MRILFSILSIAYIAAIFLLAGSPVVRQLSRFNPDSLLHIPLYGVLTLFLIFSFGPRGQKSPKKTNNPISRFLIAGFIALAVGIFDEFYQSFIPGRSATVTDIFLDIIGISLMIFIILKVTKK